MLHLTAMNHPFAILRALAAACLLFAGTAALAASPPAAGDDDAISSLQAAYARSVAPGEQADLHRELLATVLRRVKRSHATDVDVAALAAAAMKSIEPLPPGTGDPAAVFKKSVNDALRTLDPHSRYLDPRSHGNQRGESSGSFGGLGLEVQSVEGAVRVVAPTPGSPAARAGLAPGDLIVRVDDQPLAGLPLADAIARMRGEPGTPVSITVQRAGTPHEFTVSLTRDTIKRQLLRWNMEGDVLVLRLSGFSGAASASVAQAIADATAERQPRAVVLDMRGNPGGLLREAVRVADAFLAKGDIVSLRSRASTWQRAWQADADELLPGLPMVVLIDRRSASASELVADALQHNGRAAVMGERSVGKGSVQATYPLGEDKGALKLTTAIYHGPSGHTVNRVGVSPDIELLGSPAGDSARAGSGRGEAAVDAAPPRMAKASVDARRCAPLKAGDPALSCAVAYLQAGGIDPFVAGLAH
jgi:carboxyl-terminal processing protease